MTRYVEDVRLGEDVRALKVGTCVHVGQEDAIRLGNTLSMRYRWKCVRESDLHV